MSSPFQVHHIRAAETAKISQILSQQLALDHGLIKDLLYRGSIWVNAVRQRTDVEVQKEDYLRVHEQPRRFPADQINWNACIVYENEEFIVLNKPSGIPVHATVDNFVENVIFSLESLRGSKIYITQRLDVGTLGLILLSKTPEFQSEFNRLLRERTVKKTYLALTEKEIPQGLLVHYMQDSLSAPKVVSSEAFPDWAECRLFVHQSVPSQKFSGFFENEIELLTGRTHQIRSQLAFIGAPLVGDKMYGSTLENPLSPKSYKAPETIGLISHKLEFKRELQQQTYKFTAPI